MLARSFSRPFASPLTRLAGLALALTAAHPAALMAADMSCNRLLEPGQKMICSGFEPNWALEIICNGEAASNFIDAFSGDGIQTTPGSIGFASEDPWQLATSHPVTGSIAYTPNGCTDESDRVSDFTFTPTGAPGLSEPFFPFCCRVE